MPLQPLQAGLLAALLTSIALAGCIVEPGAELKVHRGDLVRAALSLEGPPGPGVPPEGRYVVGTNPPPTLPAGWEGAVPLPPGLVPLLAGRTQGSAVKGQDVLVWGPRDPALVVGHERRGALPRTVEDALAYGRAWNTTPTAGGHLIEPTADDRGSALEDPAWCNARFCLHRSTLVDWNRTHLLVHHEPEEGASVHVAELDTHLAITAVGPDRFDVDGNDPRAGQAYDVTGTILEVRAPPGTVRRAPAFRVDAVTRPGTVDLASLEGRPAVLEFFATWCPSCLKNVAHLKELQATYGDDVVIVSIGVDPWESADELRSFAEAQGIGWTLARDAEGTAARDFRVGQLSTEFVLDANGNIVHIETGVADHLRVSRIVHDLVPDHHHDPGEDHA